MNYEKKYKESLERAKEQLDGAKVFDYDNEQIAHDIRTTVYNIFPELAESEDERIRKSILEHIQLCSESIPNRDIWIAWLEKQGEQKPVEWCSEDEQNLNVCLSYIPHEFLRRWLKDIIHIKYDKPIDRVEPKFKAGDWVILTAGELSTTLQIAKVDINKKLYWFNDGSYLPIVDEECLHLWTIKDAKDGDVLHSPSHHLIWIYKNSVQYHACVNTNYAQYYDFDTNGWLGIPKDIFPATKDEQTILFERIKRAGYEWNKDKKKLIKL